MRRVYDHCRYNVYSNGCLLVSIEMDGRNDRVITNALEAMAHVMGQENQALLNPPTFKGRYAPKGDKV